MLDGDVLLCDETLEAGVDVGRLDPMSRREIVGIGNGLGLGQGGKDRVGQLEGLVLR
jgi:hypothetical protein